MAVSIPQEVTFSHKRVRIMHNVSNNKLAANAWTQTQSVGYQPYGDYGSTLTVGIKPNQLNWTYDLNTVSYPTHAGEVVQVLSAYIDNVTIEGDVRTYEDMELIYKWFIAYMTIATQGVTGAPTLSNIYSYDDEPVSMAYPHRGWTLQIRPLSLPTLTYGTDVVVPNWQMEASVVEDENLQLTQMMNSNLPALVANEFNTLSGNFGDGIENPFNYWSGNYNPQDIGKYLTGSSKKEILNFNPNSTQLTDWFSQLVSQYAEGDINLNSSSSPFSKPYTKNINISTTITAGSQSASSAPGNIITPSNPLTPPTQTIIGQIPSINTSTGYAASPTQAPIPVQSIIAAGNQIITYPYVWGGGHSGFAPSIGIPGGPGYDGHTVGFDCSGSCSYALHGGGLLSATLDSTGFESYGDSGYGQWITIFCNGSHVYMFIGPGGGTNIKTGIIFDTVDIGSGTYPPPNPGEGGPRWYPGSDLPVAQPSDFQIRHPTGY